MIRQNKGKKPSKEPQTIVEEIGVDLGNAMALQTLHDSEGGKLVINSLIQDIIGALDTMIGGTDTLTHIQYVVLASRIKERVDLVRVLTSAKSNKEVLQGLLKEELEKEKENQGS